MFENLKMKSTNLLKPIFKLSLLTIMAITFITASSTNSYAQAGGQMDGLVEDTKGDLLVVIGGGLAGAVLGLSTLSFVEEPKKHTRNIVVGASIGIIAGVIVVALEQATKSQELIYGGGGADGYASLKDSQGFNTAARSSWHSDVYGSSLPVQTFSSPQFLQYSLSY